MIKSILRTVYRQDLSDPKKYSEIFKDLNPCPVVGVKDDSPESFKNIVLEFLDWYSSKLPSGFYKVNIFVPDSGKYFESIFELKKTVQIKEVI